MKKKSKILIALLMSAAISLGVNAANAEQVVIDGISNVDYNGADFGLVINNPGITSVIQENTEFKNNKNADYGSGIAVVSEAIIKNETLFEGNDANKFGGAVINRYGANTTITGAKFNNNNSKQYGGAIFTQGSLTVNGGTTFTGNTAKGISGAIHHSIGTLNLDNVTFSGNKAKTAGAIYSEKQNADQYLVNATISNCLFENNEANNIGAVGNFSRTGKMFITNTIFRKNHATVEYAEETPMTGGAMGLGSESVTRLEKVTFDGNISEDAGGAISTRRASDGNNKDARLDIIDSKFVGNSAKTYGGAIDNYFFGSENKEGSVYIANTIFEDNSAKYGGAIYNHTKGDKSEGMSASVYTENSTFTKNYAEHGGAIYNENEATLKIVNGTFTDNYTTRIDQKPTSIGGAIYNKGSLNISDTIFTGNKSGKGGAVYTAAEDQVSTITNSSFINNKALNGAGGALFVDPNKFADGKKETVTISNSVFEGNTATSQAGAIQINQPTLKNIGLTSVTISDSSFKENIGGGAGGAISNYDRLSLTNINFTNNKTEAESTNAGGGALMLGSWSQTEINNVKFEGNQSAGKGGAIGTRFGNIYENSSAKLDIDNTLFLNNTAEGDGGAIYNAFYNSKADSNAISIKNSAFEGNKSGADGGAIYNDLSDINNNPAVVSLTDTDFTNNTAAGKGGAIFANADLSIAAVTKNVVFSGNKAEDGADIFMNKSGSTLTFNTGDDKLISIKDGISGSADKYNVAVNGEGTLEVASYVKNADITVNDFSNLWLNEGSMVNGNNNSITLNDGTGLITVNNKIDTFDKDLFTLNGEVDLAVDVDLANAKTDFFGGAVTKDGDGTFILDGVNILSNNVKIDKIAIDLYKATGLNPNQLSINTEDFYAPTILTPIRYLQGSVNENGILSYAPTGNGFKDFNPAVMASPVAAQIGGYLTQLNSYDEAFRNMDMYMLMSKEARMVMKSRNKVAIAGGNNVKFDSTSTPYENTAGWVRPYSTFEKVDLRGARKVSNVAYGSFFGGESELVDLGKGWDGMFGVYAGYNGSHQAYSGISTYQNGGTLGVVSMAYKGDFFTGLTLNAGANVGEASTFYGSDNFSMVMAGIASKSGYNIELAEGKLIIQPNFLMSYSFVNTFDYTNSAGVRMDSDPLHAIQIEPGIKLIGNLKNGWQPYGSVSMVWNIMDKTEFTANNISLPELSVKPYVKYGIGLRKTWGERLTGFFQTYFTNGGRTGVGLQAGFRFTFGQGGTEPSKSVDAPKPQKTVIKLGSCK